MDATWELKVYYDGRCPLCVREINWLRKKNLDERVAFEDYNLKTCQAKEEFGLEREQLHRKIHAVTDEGQVLKGMEVFRKLYAMLGMGWVVSWTGWPVLKWLFDGLYWCFARIRPIFGKLSGECKDDECSI